MGSKEEKIDLRHEQQQTPKITLKDDVDLRKRISRRRSECCILVLRNGPSISRRRAPVVLRLPPVDLLEYRYWQRPLHRP